MEQLSILGIDDYNGWHKRPIASLDLETTGKDPRNDRLVSAAICHSDGSSQWWLADPGVDIPAEATAIHGITTEQARQKGKPVTDVIGEIAAAIEQLITTDTPLAVYNAPYDLTLLRQELTRHDVTGPDWQRLTVIDPYVLDRYIDRYRRGKRTLTNVCAHYGVVLETSDAHTAAGDALATLLLAQALGARHPKLAVMPILELHQAQIGWYSADRTRLQEYFHRQGSTEILDTRWPFQLD